MAMFTPSVSLEDPALARQALDWMAGGTDFADALHRAKTEDYAAFVSFDRRLATVASRVGATTVRVP
jgi:predicted nucleic acid-binding protein